MDILRLRIDDPLDLAIACKLLAEPFPRFEWRHGVMELVTEDAHREFFPDFKNQRDWYIDYCARHATRRQLVELYIARLRWEIEHEHGTLSQAHADSLHELIKDYQRSEELQ